MSGRNIPENGRLTTYGGTCYPADCDHMGHMNVAAYVRKFDEGTWFLWDRLGFSARRMNSDNCGIAALESNVAYKREVLPGEAISVRSRVIEVGDKTAKFEHEMTVNRDGEEELAARCTYLVCCLDTDARKGMAWPEDIRSALDTWSAAGGKGA